jgi:hypothetical protein
MQALSEERGDAMQKLTLQVELLTEKVQLLNSEVNQQEQEHHHMMQDLQQQLDKAQVIPVLLVNILLVCCCICLFTALPMSTLHILFLCKMQIVTPVTCAVEGHVCTGSSAFDIIALINIACEQQPVLVVFMRFFAMHVSGNGWADCEVSCQLWADFGGTCLAHAALLLQVLLREYRAADSALDVAMGSATVAAGEPASVGCQRQAGGANCFHACKWAMSRP